MVFNNIQLYMWRSVLLVQETEPEKTTAARGTELPPLFLTCCLHIYFQ